MAAAKEETISSITELLTTAGKKDKAIVGARLNGWSPKELEDLQRFLDRLESIEEKKARTKPNKRVSSIKESIVAKIKVKLEEAENSGVKVQIGTIVEGLKFVAKDIEGVTKETLIGRWGSLEIAVEHVSIAKALMQFEQGRLIFYLSLSHRMKIEELAANLSITRSKVTEFDSFYRFCKSYPGLIFSSYTMGTIIRFKTEIIKCANSDERFSQLLQMQHEVVELSMQDGTKEDQILCKWFDEDLEVAEEADETTGTGADAAASGTGADAAASATVD